MIEGLIGLVIGGIAGFVGAYFFVRNNPKKVKIAENTIDRVKDTVDEVKNHK